MYLLYVCYFCSFLLLVVYFPSLFNSVQSPVQWPSKNNWRLTRAKKQICLVVAFYDLEINIYLFISHLWPLLHSGGFFLSHILSFLALHWQLTQDTKWINKVIILFNFLQSKTIYIKHKSPGGIRKIFIFPPIVVDIIIVIGLFLIFVIFRNEAARPPLRFINIISQTVFSYLLLSVTDVVPGVPP